MNVGDLFVALRVEANQLQSEITAAMRNAGTTATKSFTDNFKVAAGAVGVLGTAISAVGIDSAIKWETAFAGVAKTVDASDEELEQLAATLRSMAPDLGMSANELAGLAEQAGALGIAKENISEFVRVTAMIGQTTNVSADQAATALGQLGNVLGLREDDYERFGAALVDLGNKGASTEQEILEMATRAGGGAKIMGLAADETLGWASAVANLGIETEAGGSALQTFFLSVQKLSSAPDGLMKLNRVTGLTSEQFLKMMENDPSAALQSIIQGLGNLDEAARAQALRDLGFSEVRITRMLLGLAGNVDNLTNSVNIGREAWDDNSALQTEFGKRAETTAFQIEALKADLMETAITIGEVLLPHVKNFVAIARDVAQGISNWMKENKGLVDTLTPLLAVLSGILALKWGGNFLTSLLGQFGLNALGGALAKAILPAAVTAGTTAGTAQATAHATAATGPGLLTRMLTGLVSMQAGLTASSSIIGRAAGTAMAGGVALGLAAIASEYKDDTDKIGHDLGRQLFGSFGDEAKGLLHGTVGDSIFDAIHVMALRFQATDPLASARTQWAANLKIWATENSADWEKLSQLFIDAVERGVSPEEAYQVALKTWTGYGEGIPAGVQQGAKGLGEPDFAARLTEPLGNHLSRQLHQVGHNAGDEGGVAVIGQLFTRMTHEQRGEMERFGQILANSAAHAGRLTHNALADELHKGIPSIRDQWKQYLEATKDALDPMKQIAWLEARLSGDQLAKGLESKNPLVRRQAELMRDGMMAQLEQLKRLMGIEGEEGGDALVGAINQTKPAAGGAGRGLANAVATGIKQQAHLFHEYGLSSGNQFVNAVAHAFAAGRQKIRTALGVFSVPIATHSPPKEGPLKNIPKWGRTLGELYVEAFGGALSGSALGNLLAPRPSLAFAGINGATVELHHTVDLRGDTSGLSGADIADMLNQGMDASGLHFNLRHASALTYRSNR